MRMEIFGLLFYVIIFVIFVKAKKSAESGKNHKRSYNIPNIPKNGRTIVPNAPKNGRTIVPNVPVKKVEKNFMEHEKPGVKLMGFLMKAIAPLL